MKAVFLDRDGTINADKGYVHKVEDFVLIPGAVEALKRLQHAGFALVVVTNQSGVGRGMYTVDDYLAVESHFRELLGQEGITLAGIYACFHHAEGTGIYGVECDCRKPKPGMIKKAQKDLGICLAESFVVGDKWADVRMGVNAGVRVDHCILVRTGKAGSDEGNKVANAPLVPDLKSAADLILDQAPRNLYI